LNKYELINDVIDGRKVAVTWCSRCRTARVFSRTVRGRTLTLGISGQLWNNAMVMYDAETDSRWSQVTGRAFSGKLKGTQLGILPCTVDSTWATWRKLHGNTLAWSVKGKQDGRKDIGPVFFRTPERFDLFHITKPDLREEYSQIVLGVNVGAASKAYPREALEKPKLLKDKVGVLSILIWLGNRSEGAAVYSMPKSGSYHLDGDRIVSNNGTWRAETGRCLSGGTDLTPIPHVNAYWFAWAAFYPHTDLYGGA
jgi:hypothetical protein